VGKNLPARKSGRSPPDHVDQRIGLRIRYRQEQLQLSQSSLAEAIGVSFQQVQKYEKGQNRIRPSRLLRLASALDVPIGFFLDGLITGAGAEEVQMPRLELASYTLAFDFQTIADQDIRHALRLIVRALAYSRRA
jgi:transcriptional regulator with XRE-family HTH domain